HPSLARRGGLVVPLFPAFQRRAQVTAPVVRRFACVSAQAWCVPYKTKQGGTTRKMAAPLCLGYCGVLLRRLRWCDRRFGLVLIRALGVAGARPSGERRRIGAVRVAEAGVKLGHDVQPTPQGRVSGLCCGDVRGGSLLLACAGLCGCLYVCLSV